MSLYSIYDISLCWLQKRSRIFLKDSIVLPIGGAVMPDVISLLNACTGLAVAASGFALNNFALIVAGTLVGASGTMLTRKMSDAMGRSFGNVLFGDAKESLTKLVVAVKAA